MATIEELEMQLQQRLSIIDLRLSRFYDNLGRIGSVIGKDSSYVYDVLKKKYNSLASDFSSMVNKNVETLTIMIERSEKILSVLDEVSKVIDTIESSHDDEMLSVRGEVDEKMESLASSVEELTSEVSDRAGNLIGPSMLGYVVPGAAAYIILRMIGTGRTVSLVAAAAVAYIVNSDK
uniref:Uncharacterized protein n=1 Tax=viral metagenome TaxID=1070528 RepID=A0A6H1ZY04_9ZZZZ